MSKQHAFDIGDSVTFEGRKAKVVELAPYPALLIVCEDEPDIELMCMERELADVSDTH